MKLAVTYENGAIFQHFGHTETVKIYTVENGKVGASEVIGTEGHGHGALAAFLKEKGVAALICGGLGGGAIAALQEAGISIYAGNQGSADEAAAKFAAGQLAANAEANCHHHGHGEEHSCGNGSCSH
ncbi:NifB/NifX family molybdenum-iron cluster-binding protein [Pyramidobacter piscolens]|uniref:NifB/NifX family molybdenum-iron cluster-binding protein n=1 Tax=Pyramidobacter piscolens TaxID=638849 RepID=UPI001FCCA5A0|nr:NifB/NifX family molybdenum-iron cluster-binding protein [Pyramidobacter piscolens]BDF77495.1 hypothetical protein CE91St28_02890 [Pyramidobacter piscolens]